jgi:hypothetical protein
MCRPPPKHKRRAVAKRLRKQDKTLACRAPPLPEENTIISKNRLLKAIREVFSD